MAVLHRCKTGDECGGGGSSSGQFVPMIYPLQQVLYFVNVSSEKGYIPSMGWVVNVH